MALPSIECKALFKAQVTRDRLTLETAARERVGVTWYHLAEGLERRRALAEETRTRFAAYIGLRPEEVFGSTDDAAA